MKEGSSREEGKSIELYKSSPVYRSIPNCLFIGSQNNLSIEGVAEREWSRQRIIATRPMKRGFVVKKKGGGRRKKGEELNPKIR